MSKGKSIKHTRNHAEKKLKRKKIQDNTETISTLSKFRQIIWLVVCSNLLL